MKAVIQIVEECSLTANTSIVWEHKSGLLVYLGVHKDDTEDDVLYTAQKCSGLRIFPDRSEKMNLSVGQVRKDILIVSQFTLYGNTRKGKRPSYNDAAHPQKAEKLYEEFIRVLKKGECSVYNGIFGAKMRVSYTNCGPVTIIIDSKNDRIL